MPYELTLDMYRGPLGKLLELIEERKLEVTEISLARVTDDFLKYLKTLERAAGVAGDAEREEHLRVLADFIVVASRLVFIKSRSLLPDLALTGEEEAEIRDLEGRLKLYQALRPAMKLLARRWAGGLVAHGRAYFLHTSSAAASNRVFYPGHGIEPTALTASLNRVFESLRALELERQVVRESVVTLEEKIESVIKRLEDIVSTSFKNLVGATSKADVIVAFLAILHLAREQLIVLEQKHHLSDIIITKHPPTS